MGEHNTNKSRMLAFDALKLFAIFLVLWGHAIQYLLSSNYVDEVVWRVIYTFHMPLFMMISGYFAVSSMRMQPAQFFTKKFRQLLLPCISWAVICFLLRRYWLDGLLGTNVGSFSGLLSGTYWFLKSCFFCYVIAYIGKHLIGRKVLWVVVTLLVAQSLQVYSIHKMYPCFLMGMLLRDDIKIMNWVEKNYLLIGIAFLFLLYFHDKSFYVNSHGQLKALLSSGDTVVILQWLYVRLYRLVIGIVGSLFFISLFKRYLNIEKPSHLMSEICSVGGVTLGIYILQAFILEYLMPQVICLDGLPFFLTNFIVMPIISLLVLILCVIIIKIMCRSKWLAYLFFGKERPISLRNVN